jgi:transcriptional regulator GlxA family with amidase domain
LLPYLFVQPIEIALEPEHFLEPLLRLLTQTIEDELDPLILHHLFQALVNWLVQTVPLGQLDPPLRHVLDQIQSRYQEPLDNESLGRLSGWQRQHFIRRFKAAIGLTPHRFLIRQRLHQASLLLLAGASVSQAARKSGYADLKPFSKAFRQHYGIAPSHYRHFFRQTP